MSIDFEGCSSGANVENIFGYEKIFCVKNFYFLPSATAISF